MSIKLSTLPDWFKSATPIPAIDVIIDYNEHEGVFFVDSDANNADIHVFIGDENMKNPLSELSDVSIIQIYDVLNDNDVKFVFSEKVLDKFLLAGEIDDAEEDASFDSSEDYLDRKFYQSESYEFLPMSIFIPEGDGSGSGTILFASSEISNVKMYAQDLQYFSEVISERYASNVNDFLYAYDFINYHPAFWSKEQTGKKYHWDIDGGINRISQSFYRDDNSETGIECVLETGEHVEPDCRFFYHAPDLTVSAESYESAIIQLANNIADKFYDNGVRKESVV